MEDTMAVDSSAPLWCLRAEVHDFGMLSNEKKIFEWGDKACTR